MDKNIFLYSKADVIRWVKNNKHEVFEYARHYGGSFLYSLTVALLNADHNNTVKIVDTWYKEYSRLFEMKIIKEKESEK